MEVIIILYTRNIKYHIHTVDTNTKEANIYYEDHRV